MTLPKYNSTVVNAEVLTENLLPTVKSILQNFATKPDFTSQIGLIFGEDNDYTDLHQAWLAGEFVFPTIEVLSKLELDGANGGFSSTTNTIYLSEEFLLDNQSNIPKITDVFLEEYGHFIDAQINVNDILGDEGAIFSTLVQGEVLSNEQLELLKIEDDTANLTINGQTFQIEQASDSGSGGAGGITKVIEEYKTLDDVQSGINIDYSYQFYAIPDRLQIRFVSEKGPSVVFVDTKLRSGGNSGQWIIPDGSIDESLLPGKLELQVIAPTEGTAWDYSITTTSGDKDKDELLYSLSSWKYDTNGTGIQIVKDKTVYAKFPANSPPNPNGVYKGGYIVDTDPNTGAVLAPVDKTQIGSNQIIQEDISSQFSNTNQILQNAKVEKGTYNNDKTIGALFKLDGLSLIGDVPQANLARLLGYNHFNWLQVIGSQISPDVDWYSGTRQDFENGNSVLVSDSGKILTGSKSFTDPLSGGNFIITDMSSEGYTLDSFKSALQSQGFSLNQLNPKNFIATSSAGKKFNLIDHPNGIYFIPDEDTGLKADTKGFYLDIPGYGGDDTEYSKQLSSNTSILSFEDSPSITTFDSSKGTNFTTYLVGVKDDLDYKKAQLLPISSSNFKWYSTASSFGGKVFGASSDLVADPFEVTGGVDITDDNVTLDELPDEEKQFLEDNGVDINPPNVNISGVRTENTQDVELGQEYTYTLTVTNNGADPATNVVLIETLPSGLDLVSASSFSSIIDENVVVVDLETINSGESKTVDFTVNSVLANQLFSTTNITSNEYDSDVSDNFLVSSKTVNLISVPKADLELTQTVSNQNPQIGEEVTFTLTLTNQGPGIASQIQVENLLPTELTFTSYFANQGTYDSSTGIWDVGNVLDTQFASLELSATVDSNQSITNIAEVFAVAEEDPDSTPNNNNSNEDDQASVTLNKSNIAININSPSIAEGNDGNSNLTFTVTLSEASTETITVDYATADDSAIATEDYTATSGTLEFAPGETEKTITVPIIGDTKFESSETFKVNLTNASNGAIATAVATGNIENDEKLVAIDTFMADNAMKAMAYTVNTLGDRDINIKLNDNLLDLGTDAVYDNLVGFYEITSIDGGIDTNGDGVDDLLPEDNGYARAAIANRITDWKLRAGSSGDTSKNTTVEQFGDVIIAGDKIYAPFVIANGGSIGFDGFITAEDKETDDKFNDAAVQAEDLVAYFAFIGANPDDAVHLQARGDNTFGFEDLPANLGISDNDFNDAVFRFDFSLL